MIHIRGIFSLIVLLSHHFLFFYRRSSKLWVETRSQLQPSMSCPITFYENTLQTTPGGSKRSQRNTTLPGTASTTGASNTRPSITQTTGCHSFPTRLTRSCLQGERPSRPAGWWAEGSPGVSQGAGVLPQVAPGGRDDSHCPVGRLAKGESVSGLRPREGAEATTGGRVGKWQKNRVCVCGIHAQVLTYYLSVILH